MSFAQTARTVRSFADTVTDGPAWVGGGVAVVGTLLVETFTSVLASVLGLLFVIDLFLGVMVAVHNGGIDAFDWHRFWRAFIKMAAALAGIALFAAGDLLIQDLGVPRDWKPLTAAGMTAMCWGFFMSALSNFGHFFPRVTGYIERMLRKVQRPQDHRQRRSTDDPPGFDG